MKTFAHTTTEPNGKLEIDLGWSRGWHRFSIIGGPFARFRRGVNADHGVCLREETGPDYDTWLPIPDFSAPEEDQTPAVEHAIREALSAALSGKRVWVGCMGGWGRTGLFLALIAKTCGIPDPVGYVRSHYSPRAVETNEQVCYVDGFDVSALQQWLFGRAWRERWYRTVFWWA